MPIPPHLDTMLIPESQTIEQAWRKMIVVWLSDLATCAIDFGVSSAALGSSYGCINVEFELEALRRAQSWLDAHIEELRVELCEAQTTDSLGEPQSDGAQASIVVPSPMPNRTGM